MRELRGDEDRNASDADFAASVAARGARLLHAGDLLTGSRPRAQDLVQHALAQAYVRWATIGEGNPEAYVRTSMLHAPT